MSWLLLGCTEEWFVWLFSCWALLKQSPVITHRPAINVSRTLSTSLDWGWAIVKCSITMTSYNTEVNKRECARVLEISFVKLRKNLNFREHNRAIRLKCYALADISWLVMTGLTAQESRVADSCVLCKTTRIRIFWQLLKECGVNSHTQTIIRHNIFEQLVFPQSVKEYSAGMES